MPVQPTYPGVYVQEISSGVRTIVGVSTSVTAFVGTAKRGPINKPVTIYNYAEYETRFGGLSSSSEMSYAVRSFFLNGGSQAVIVRLAKNVLYATVSLPDSGGTTGIAVTALDGGSDGNNIDVNVDYDTITPNSTFNLTVRLRSSSSPSDNRTEVFSNLSMDSNHPKYVENVVNGASDLVTVARIGSPAGWTAGYLEGPVPSSVATYLAGVTASKNQFRLAVDGDDPVSLTLTSYPYLLMTELRDDIITAAGIAGLAVTASVVGGAIRITSSSTAEDSRVEVYPGASNDCSVILGLGPENGGNQVDGSAVHRPLVTPAAVTASSGAIAAAALPAGALSGEITVSLDGNISQTISVSTTLVGASLAARLIEVAAYIQTQVRSLRSGLTAYDNFVCSATATTLEFTNGSRGEGSSITMSVVFDAPSTVNFSISTAAQVDTYLSGGSESTFTDSEAYSVYIGSRANREGIYALESVDIFNLLCLPGIPNGTTERSGILSDADAYCRERRAFFIIDASRDDDTPSEMSTAIVGTSLPKSDNAAVYFPWIKIPDPLNGSQPRTSAPCGAIAGIFSRTDSNRGVWKAPAGTEATLTGVTSLTYTLTDPENGSLNPLGANCLRTFPVYGNVVWGSRTLRGNDQMASEYKYVPVRRLAYYMEESLYRGLKWAVFEPNDEPLWAQIRLNVGAFMQNLFRQGAFQGQKRDDAYFVKCDRETTTQNDINLGIVNIWVGFAPLKPAEFVVLYIQQIAGQVQV